MDANGEHRGELLRVFKNAAEDIDANRAGRLGPGQLRRLRRSVVNTTLLMTCVVIAFLAVVYAVAARPYSVAQVTLIVLVAVVGLAVGVFRSRHLARAVRAGVVECLAGPVRVTMRGRAGWWLAVGERSFQLPVHFWHVGSGLPYRVYVAPAARLIVAMEPDDAGPAAGRHMPVDAAGDGPRG